MTNLLPGLFTKKKKERTKINKIKYKKGEISTNNVEYKERENTMNNVNEFFNLEVDNFLETVHQN